MDSRHHFKSPSAAGQNSLHRMALPRLISLCGVLVLLAGCSENAATPQDVEAVPKPTKGGSTHAIAANKAPKHSPLGSLDAPLKTTPELEQFLVDLNKAKNPVELRSRALKIAENDYLQLLNLLGKLDDEGDSQARLIIVSALETKAGRLDFKNGLKLLSSLGDRMKNPSGTLTNCLGQWAAGLEPSSIADMLGILNAENPKWMQGLSPLGLYARSSINVNPDGVFQTIDLLRLSGSDQLSEAYRQAGSQAFSRNLPFVQQKLIELATNGNSYVNVGLQTVAKKVSASDPDSYANFVEQYRSIPAVYDNLLFGFLQTIGKMDQESAKAWLDTFHDPTLKAAAQKSLNLSPR